MMLVVIFFANKIRNGKYPGFAYKETSSITDTVLYLKHQHKEIRNQVRAGYVQAAATVSVGASVDGQMLKLAPFASVGTMDNINERILQALRRPAFLYYRQLRSVDGVGEYRANKVMASFATKESLQQFAKLPTCVKTLRRIGRMDEDTAKRVRDFFRANPQHGEDSVRMKKRKQGPAIVSPQVRSGCSINPHNVTSCPLNARRRLFEKGQKQSLLSKNDDDGSALGCHGDEVVVESDGDTSVLECLDDEVIVESDDDRSIVECHESENETTKPKAPARRLACLDDEVIVETDDDRSVVECYESEDGTTKPIAPARQCLRLDLALEDKSKLWDDSSSDDGSLFEPIFRKPCRKSPACSEGSSSWQKRDRNNIEID